MNIQFKNIATTDRPDEFLGTIALDKGGDYLNKFVKNNLNNKSGIKAIMGNSFPKVSSLIMTLKVLFNDSKVEEIEIPIVDFFNLFVQISFRVSHKSDIEKDEEDSGVWDIEVI